MGLKWDLGWDWRTVLHWTLQPNITTTRLARIGRMGPKFHDAEGIMPIIITDFQDVDINPIDRPIRKALCNFIKHRPSLTSLQQSIAKQQLHVLATHHELFKSRFHPFNGDSIRYARKFRDGSGVCCICVRFRDGGVSPQKVMHVSFSLGGNSDFCDMATSSR